VPTLVDTSVWIDFFVARPTQEVTRLKGLIGHEELLIGDLILTELLQGVRTDQETVLIESAFRAYPVVALVGEQAARKSAFNYRALRQPGITARKTIDCLIATWCIENRVPLLHNDGGFRPFVRLGLLEA
jgi:predicted nucleic acid-binding protein